MNSDILNRKGAKRVNDIPEGVLRLLNVGEIETVNLTEWLALDQRILIKHNFPTLRIADQAIQIAIESIGNQKKPTAMSTIKIIGAELYEYYANHHDYATVLNGLSNHPADTIRCYATYLIALNEHLSLKEKFNQARTLVADHHFGVREVVWMALRPEIDAHLEESISFLSQWATDENENVRRFTSEATRPRGVWCKHIAILKEQPELALPILNKLKSDPAKYVQDSVGNWLNDASKTQPDFVVSLCEKWRSESPTKETAKIIKKARRTIDKKMKS
jgi:3-methyladenine DNA glycosylase AlkC